MILPTSYTPQTPISHPIPTQHQKQIKLMQPKKLSILCAAAILSMATASAELTLPINLDFEQQDIFKDLQKNKDFLVYIMPRTEATGIGVIEDPTNPSNKVLEIRSNGTSEQNRLKIVLPTMTQDFEYQFRCKLVGEAVPGFRSLLSFYTSPQWDKVSPVIVPRAENNMLKFKSTEKELTEWTTIKVLVHTDGKPETPDTYSVFVNDEKVLEDAPLPGKQLDGAIDVAEIALDFTDPIDVTKLKYLIDDIRVGSPKL